MFTEQEYMFVYKVPIYCITLYVIIQYYLLIYITVQHIIFISNNNIR